MLLKTVLDVNGINRNTFNSLQRRTGLRFMKRGLVDGKRGDRYTLTHAVALGAVLAFQHLGIEASEAASVVDALYDALIDWVGMRVLTPEDFPAERAWITISRFSDGSLGWASGSEGADTFSSNEPMAKLSVNVAAIVAELLPRAITAQQAQ